MFKKLVCAILLLSLFSGVFLSACKNEPLEPVDEDDGDLQGYPLPYTDFSVSPKTVNGSTNTLYPPPIELGENLVFEYRVVNRRRESEERIIDNVEYSVEIDDIAFGEVVRVEFEYGKKIEFTTMGWGDKCYAYTSILAIEVKPDTGLIPPNPKYDNIILGYINFTLFAKNLEELKKTKLSKWEMKKNFSR